ncbi:HAD family hydrolase [Acetanaerobacterium elongatum]|uniref:Phosphoglycolate phosphatase n=1 Tax=Acetanaerobacterium elongatum TaxID=258515 RepID=A0A1G9WWJ3_9FIRM|nr:HAD family hydrolase [Acetanaerobacterium elongatum]SDM88878.1 phosphoglycolate phosphatase [Acetanaerobacterium elongatum]
MIKCCIFDLDGTLLNTLDDLAASCNYALSLYGYKTYPADDYRYFVGNGVSVLLDRTLPPDVDERQKQKVKEAFSKHYAQHYIDLTVPYKGIEGLLRILKLKGYLVCVVSNKPHDYSKELITKIFGEKFFNIVLGASEELPKKPAPDGVLYCMNKLRLSASECVYIGDSNVDVLTAKNAKMPSIGVAWGFRGEEELKTTGADYIVQEPKEIAQLLEHL